MLTHKMHVYLVPFSRYSELVVESRKCFLPDVHLAPELGVVPLEFHQERSVQKLESLGYRVVMSASSYVQPF